MIEMKCPSCGAGGRLPREKVNSRLTCKRCLRVFHLTPSGQAVLGEPAPPKDAPKPRAPREGPDYQTVAAFDDLTSKLTKLKIPAIPPRTIAIVAGVLVVGLLVYWFFSRQSIEARSEAVAACLKKPELMRDVIALASSGTEMDTIKWYNEAYKKFAELSVALGGLDPSVKLNVHEPSQGGGTMVDVTYYNGGPRKEGTAIIDALQPVPSLANSDAKLTLSVSLCFVSDAFGNWQLDGTRTLEAFAAATAPGLPAAK